MNLENALIKFQRLLNQTWQAKEAGMLSQNEFDYLACIFEAENQAPAQLPDVHDDSSHLSALAEQMQVRKSSASLMVNKLEKRGFIERVTCLYDARAQHILLTKNGRDVYRQSKKKIYGAVVKTIASQLGSKDCETFKMLLTQLTDPQD